MKTNGVIAEMLKNGSEMLLSLVLEVFNDVVTMDARVPETWRSTKLTVIVQKGDPLSRQLSAHRHLTYPVQGVCSHT